MPVPGLDHSRCLKRNRLAARKGFNAAPLTLSAKLPGPIDTNVPGVAAGLRVVAARGTMPRSDAAAVERINRLRGPDHPALSASDVWIVTAEAANTNYINKYYMFLGNSTLRNIARRAEESIAFMNSHRTGGLSTDAELPYGRTFAGRYEEAVAPDGRTFSRTLLGVYMLRGQRPNGANGPSTDELYEGIKAGTIFDVSLGIRGGDEVCDVCGNPLGAWDNEADAPLCDHIPGTRHAMTDDQVQAQIARGVPRGLCSFTLEDATASEVSPVFDGAVPGAGFRKALSMSKSRTLSASTLADARRSFGPLALRSDFAATPSPAPAGQTRGPAEAPKTPSTRGPTMPKNRSRGAVPLSALTRILEEYGIEVDDDTEGTETIPVPATPPAAPAPAPAPALPATPASAVAPPERPASADAHDARFRALEEQNQRLEATLREERIQRQKDAADQLRATVLAQSQNWADERVRLSQATPAERDELVALHAQAAMDDHDNPAPIQYRDATNTPQTGTRVQALTALWSKRGTHHFSAHEIASPFTLGQGAVPGSGTTTTAAPAAPAGPQPLFVLSEHAGVPATARRDPILDAMLAANSRYHGVIPGANGHGNGSSR